MIQRFRFGLPLPTDSVVSCADGRAVRAFLMAWHPPETGGYSLEGFF